MSKIFGPGNQFVTIAKQLATRYGVAIDMPAGPSELLIYADDSAIPSFVASDLLSQAEHGTDSQVILVSSSKKMIIFAVLGLFLIIFINYAFFLSAKKTLKDRKMIW